MKSVTQSYLRSVPDHTSRIGVVGVICRIMNVFLCLLLLISSTSASENSSDAANKLLIISSGKGGETFEFEQFLKSFIVLRLNRAPEEVRLKSAEYKLTFHIKNHSGFNRVTGRLDLKNAESDGGQLSPQNQSDAKLIFMDISDKNIAEPGKLAIFMDNFAQKIIAYVSPNQSSPTKRTVEIGCFTIESGVTDLLKSRLQEFFNRSFIDEFTDDVSFTSKQIAAQICTGNKALEDKQPIQGDIRLSGTISPAGKAKENDKYDINIRVSWVAKNKTTRKFELWPFQISAPKNLNLTASLQTGVKEGAARITRFLAAALNDEGEWREPAWTAAYNPNFSSAVQHAIRLRRKDPLLANYMIKSITPPTSKIRNSAEADWSFISGSLKWENEDIEGAITDLVNAYEFYKSSDDSKISVITLNRLIAGRALADIFNADGQYNNAVVLYKTTLTTLDRLPVFNHMTVVTHGIGTLDDAAVKNAVVPNNAISYQFDKIKFQRSIQYAIAVSHLELRDTKSATEEFQKLLDNKFDVGATATKLVQAKFTSSNDTVDEKVLESVIDTYTTYRESMDERQRRLVEDLISRQMKIRAIRYAKNMNNVQFFEELRRLADKVPNFENNLNAAGTFWGRAITKETNALPAHNNKNVVSARDYTIRALKAWDGLNNSNRFSRLLAQLFVAEIDIVNGEPDRAIERLNNLLKDIPSARGTKASDEKALGIGRIVQFYQAVALLTDKNKADAEKATAIPDSLKGKNLIPILGKRWEWNAARLLLSGNELNGTLKDSQQELLKLISSK